MRESDVVTPRCPDIVVYDAEENEILVVEVLSSLRLHRNLPTIKRGIEAYIRNAALKSAISPSFAMFIDTKTIQVAKWLGDSLSEPILELDSVEVFSCYEPDFGTKTIYGYYLAALTEGWLRDFSFHWKYKHPPKEKELSAIDLLPLLKDSWAKSIEDE